MVKKTPLNEVHRKMGARMVEFAGFEMPMQYTGIIDEHLAVRKAAGIFDVSHMGDLWIYGKDAVDFMNYIQPNDAADLKPGEMLYSHILDDDGHIKDDTIFGLYEEDRFLMVPNAATKDMILAHLEKIRDRKGFDVKIEDETDKLACIALQGPLSPEIMAKLTDDTIAAMDSFRMTTATIEDLSGDVIVSTTGYTGEKGFEIITRAEDGIKLWKMLLSLGKEEGLKPCGLGARDTLRMEKGFLLSGQDFNEAEEKHTTIETGYKWIVKLNHEFIGRPVIEEQMSTGTKVLFRGMIVNDKGIPRHGYTVHNEDGEVIGHITSGTMSPSLKKGIALGYLKKGYWKKGTEVYIDIRGKRVSAEVRRPPLV